MASGVITGFITAPFLVHRLGQTNYGLWILIASLTSYLNLADLGLRASITRHVSFFRAKQDYASINGILTTAQAILLGAAAAAVVGTLVMLGVFSHFNDVPADELGNVRLAMMLAGLTVALTLALSIFDAALWAYERFDVLNVIDVIGDLGQMASIMYLVSRGGSLVSIAAAIMTWTLLREGTKAIACFRIERELRLAPSRISAWAFQRLFGYGLWKFLWSIGNRATTQCGPLIIGARLTVLSVTPYSVSSRLVGYAQGISNVATGVVIPTATALHAGERDQSQRTLLLEGGKYCFTLSLFFVASITLLGRSFIGLWMGSELAAFATLATILALGEAIPMSQWITYSVLLGKDRHRVVACASLIEMVSVIGLGLALAVPYGLPGVCFAVAVSGFVIRGLLPMVYGCRLLEISIWRYVMETLMPPLFAAIAPAAGLAALVWWHPPQRWIELFLYEGAFGIAYLITGSAIVVGPEQVRTILAQLKRTAAGLAGTREEPAP